MAFAPVRFGTLLATERRLSMALWARGATGSGGPDCYGEEERAGRRRSKAGKREAMGRDFSKAGTEPAHKIRREGA